MCAGITDLERVATESITSDSAPVLRLSRLLTGLDLPRLFPFIHRFASEFRQAEQFDRIVKDNTSRANREGSYA
jgi:hypothetical protein